MSMDGYMGGRWDGGESDGEAQQRERADRLERELEALRQAERLTNEEQAELLWLAERWSPDSEKEAHPEMAMRMAELVLKRTGVVTRGTVPRWDAVQRKKIDRWERQRAVTKAAGNADPGTDTEPPAPPR